MKERIMILAVIAVFGIVSCNNPDNKNNKGQAKIEFSETEFDFGMINQGEKVSHRFVFKNSGNGDLYIKDVDPSCGCTVASFPNKAVKPGETSYIETTFDSDGYRGMNVKEVEVRTNCKHSIINLTLSATVEVSDK
jgi:hypothetical protein